MIADNPRRTATAGESLDRMISLAQEMLRNRHDMRRLRDDLLEYERNADRARAQIDKLMRRQLQLAALQTGLAP